MAVLLTLLLFLAWALLGLAVLVAGGFRWSLKTLLFAPTVGFTTLLVTTYFVVRLGVPVSLLAFPISATLFVFVTAVLWRMHPKRARLMGVLKQYRLFGVVLIGTFCLTAWPLFGFGFDWVANFNDDMANYCLIATGYRDHGYATPPTSTEVIAGHDQSKTFFKFILLEIRPGAEVLLAFTSAITKWAPQQVFMPVIIALNLTLVSAASGMAMAVTRQRMAGLLTALLLAVSAVTTFGVVQQLIAQVGGLALICTALVLVNRSFRFWPRRVLIRQVSVGGIVFSGLLLFYPEAIPLLVSGCVILGLRDLCRYRLNSRRLVFVAGAVSVMIVLLPAYTYGSISFLATQGQYGSSHSAEWLKELFPFYVTPRGPALVLGLLPQSGPESTEMTNACVIAGLVLFVAAIVPIVAGLRRGHAMAATLLACILLACWLSTKGAAFGLFKLSMYAQPFLWAVVAAWVVTRRTRQVATLAGAVVILLAVQNARVQFWYVNQSRGTEGRVELPSVTSRRTLSEFRKTYAHQTQTQNIEQVLVATQSVALRKLLMAEIRGVPTGQLGVNPFNRMVLGSLKDIEEAPRLKFRNDWATPIEEFQTAYSAEYGHGGPTIIDPVTKRPLHQLISATPNRAAHPANHTLVVAAVGPLSILNRQQFPETGTSVSCVPLSEMHNFAVFCDATGSRQYFLGMEEPANIGLYQTERDGAIRKRSMAGVGRALVLEILNPTPRVRVLVSSTSSFKIDPNARVVAPGEVIGEQRVSLGGVGIGGARLISPPLNPQTIGENHFIALHFGDPTRNPNRLGVVEKLWAADLTRDRRWLTGFVRDISILSEEEYANFHPPVQLSRFPTDLTHPHLEYSGFSEDGWVGQAFKVRLSQPSSGQELVLRGQIPQFSTTSTFCTDITVLIDGREVKRQSLATGEFEVRVPSGPAVGPHWIECRFSHAQTLPPPDGRTMVANLRFIGFEAENPALSHPPESLAAFPGDLKHPKLERVGIDTDGWGRKTFKARLMESQPRSVAVIRGQIPQVSDPEFQTEMTLLIDGKEVGRRILKPGEFEVRVPAGNKTGARWVECQFSATQQLPTPDTRAVSAHLRFFGFESPRPGE